MNKYFKILLALVVFLAFCCGCLAQGQITTRREKLKDLPARITKVVIPQDDFLSEVLREGVTRSWTITPYEFCTLDEFEIDKTNPNYYFLLTVNEQTRKETVPGLKFLTLVKGGEEASKGIGEMLEVVSFPLCSAQGSSGREMIMIPAILKIMQRQADKMIDSELKAYTTVKATRKDMQDLSKKKVYICSEDLAPQVSQSLLNGLSKNLIVEDEDLVDNIFTEGTQDAAVGYIVAPEEPEKGSFCYKMLISADTHELLFYRKHKISTRRGKGFLPGDISTINNIVR